MSPEIQLKQPFPSRRAATALRDQLVDYLIRNRPSVGAPFLTDAELVRISALSRSTVRRALDDLHREGWIERRIGQGTFIGPRLGIPAVIQPRRSEAEGPQVRRVIRLAVLIFGIGDLAHDWYTPLVLDGIDEYAERCAVSVELIGNRERDVEAISRRISQNPPDVLVCMASDPRQAFVIRDAQRLGVRCIVTGTPHMQLGLPAIVEDNRQAMRLAVEHLVKLGHKRIGLVLQRALEPWVFERHEAFLDTLEACGLEPDGALVHWTPTHDPKEGNPRTQEAVARFIARESLTAIIPASFLPMLYVDRLARDRRIRIPDQLSLISMEQDIGKAQWLGGMKLTYVQFPMREMGRRLAEMARALVEQETAPAQVVLPVELVAGDSTRPVAAGG